MIPSDMLRCKDGHVIYLLLHALFPYISMQIRFNLETLYDRSSQIEIWIRRVYEKSVEELQTIDLMEKYL